MPGPLTDVQPGDLITASQFNDLVHAVEALDARVTALEAAPHGGQTIITGLSPGPYHIGDDIHVFGSGFGIPAQAVVTMDSQRVNTMKPGSNDTELVFTIPNLQGVTGAGRTVTLNVSANGTASINLLVFPFMPDLPSGQVFVTLSEAPSDSQLLAGHNYIFVYTVKAIADLDETYTLTPTVSTGWPAVAVDAGGQPLTPSEISLPQGNPPAGSTINVRVKVSIPNGTPTQTAATMRLAVASTRNPTQVWGRSGGEAIVVGGAPPTPSTDIVLSYVPGSATAPIVPAGAPAPSEAGGIVTIAPFSSSYRLTFSAQITDPGTYLVEVIDQLDPKWIVRLSANQTSVQMTVSTADTNIPIHVFVRALSAAQPSNVVLRVSSTVSPPESGQFSQPIKI